MEGMASMTDGDPFGRRSGRRPDDREYSQPWNDEGALDDPYAAPQPPENQRQRSPRRTRGNEQQYDPQQPNVYRPSEPRYADDDQDPNWGRGSGQQPSWPERPYANPPQQRAGQQDPYARQRGYDYDDQDAVNEVDDWADQQQRGARRGAVIQRPRAARPSLPRPSIPPALSAAMAGQDSRLLLIAAGSILSLAIMAIVTVTRVDALPGWFPMHIDASGEVTKFGTDSALWRLPFGLAMLTVMNIGSAIVLGLREQRIAWILIGSLPLIHIIAWIALILIGW
jgi:hypothetical protein